jgi:hypothetical protein
MSEHDHEVAPQVSAAALRELIARLERSREEQPARLAQARKQAEMERKGALAAEPWDELLSALPTYGPHGELTGMMALPSIDGQGAVRHAPGIRFTGLLRR